MNQSVRDMQHAWLKENMCKTVCLERLIRLTPGRLVGKVYDNNKINLRDTGFGDLHRIKMT
jgi:hypothetical protein